MKAYFILVSIFCCACLMLLGQESERSLDEEVLFEEDININITQKKATKYLTPTQTDLWKLTAEPGTILILYVKTSAFDPVLQVANAANQILAEADDPGSESRLMVRLAEAGNYEVRVSGFRGQGGGRYTLEVLQCLPTTLAIGGNPVVCQYDDKAVGYHDFTVQKGQIIIPVISDFQGYWELRDPKGQVCTNRWNTSITIEQDGLHCLIVHGQADSKYQVEIKEARMEDFPPLDQTIPITLSAGEMRVYNISNTTRQILEAALEKQGSLETRFIFAPLHSTPEGRPIPENSDTPPPPPKKNEILPPPLQFFPMASKGQYWRMAAQLNCNDRYQLQLLARSNVEASLLVRNPVYDMMTTVQEQLRKGEEYNGSIPVGGCIFLSMRAMPGELMKIRAESNDFDPVLRLYYPDGKLWKENDDSHDLSSEMWVMFQQPGTYLLQIGSLGNGGGGKTKVTITPQSIPQFPIQNKYTGYINERSYVYGSLEARQGQCLVISVRSATVEPYVEIHGPTGILVASAQSSGANKSCLLELAVPASGRYTFSIYAQKGRGMYNLWIWPAE